MPLATYRVQLNGHFGFQAARALVPYLHRLGVTDLYASPVLQASPGSMHGYDTTDPTRLNPELGSEQDFDALAEELSGLGMGLLLDIVPNHMAASPDNPWWLDVLEHRQSSPYADFFDIDWDPAWGHVRGRVVLPVLGRPYGEALESGEIRLSLEEDGLFVRYYGLRLPLEARSWALLLERCLEAVAPPASGEFVALLDMARRLPPHAVPEGQGRAEAYAQRRAGTDRLWHAINASPRLHGLLAETVAHAHERQDGPELLDRLLSLQPYQLVFWRTGLEKLNYRRFFDISGLVGVRVELQQVLEAGHSLVFRLVRQGKVTGLRIDHIDGLSDPHEYLLRLQSRLSGSVENGDATPPGEGSKGMYVVVEKVLSGDEALPEEWPVSGTTGYDFLNLANAVFVSPEGFRALEKAHRESFEDVVYRTRKQVIQHLFPAETFALCQRLASLAQHDRVGCDLRREDMSRALVEVTACMPVYRTYICGEEVSPCDRACIEQAVRRARERAPALEPRALDFLRRVLLLETPAPWQAALEFVMDWQQATGPVMAKGLEDTALYSYSVLLSLNDVGGNPGATDFSIQGFHRRNAERRERWPHTLNATSTHDTKRSEDVRARINVLSEMPDAWSKRLAAWGRWNRPGKRLVRGALVPGLNEEKLLYQTMLGPGPWPRMRCRASPKGSRATCSRRCARPGSRRTGSRLTPSTRPPLPAL